MKHWHLLAVLVCFGSIAARADGLVDPAVLDATAARPTPTPILVVPPVEAPAASAPAPDALLPSDWMKIGRSFGGRGQWQFGLDKSVTAGACGFYFARAHAFLAGPCRDLLVLARDKEPIYHVGGAVLARTARGPNYTARFGAKVGPLAHHALQYVADHVPALDDAGLKTPSGLAYVGKITTLDMSLGRIEGQLDYGVGIKVDVPLADLKALLPGF